MQLRIWDREVQMRLDKPETLCPVFLPDGPWWATCVFVDPLLLLSIVFPSPRSEVQAPMCAQAGPGSSFCPAALKEVCPSAYFSPSPGLHRGAAWCSLPAIPSKVHTHPAALLL